MSISLGRAIIAMRRAAEISRQHRKQEAHPYFTADQTAETSIAEGGAFAFMVALGETYFPAFVLASGLGSIAAGLITTVPLLLGATLQLIAPQLLPKFKSYRRWVLTFTVLQGLALLPLIYFAAVGGISLELMFVSAVVYFSTGLLAGPVWNTWMTGLLPFRMQTGFFAERNRRMQIASVLGFIVGGLILHTLPSSFSKTAIFIPLFTLAFLSRSLSVSLLVRQPEGSEFEPRHKAPASPLQFWKHIQKQTSMGHLVSYLLFFQFAVNIAGPFFAPYMLTRLKFSYFEYSILILACYLGKIVALPWAAEKIRKSGPEGLLLKHGTLVAMIPLGFLLFPKFLPLVAVQFAAGLAWAGYELASLLLLLSMLPKSEKSTFLSYYYFGNAFAVATSSLLGGYLLKSLSEKPFAVIFVTSIILRLTAQVIILRRPIQPAEWNKSSASDSEELVHSKSTE